MPTLRGEVQWCAPGVIALIHSEPCAKDAREAVVESPHRRNMRRSSAPRVRLFKVHPRISQSLQAPDMAIGCCYMCCCSAWRGMGQISARMAEQPHNIMSTSLRSNVERRSACGPDGIHQSPSF